MKIQFKTTFITVLAALSCGLGLTQAQAHDPSQDSLIQTNQPLTTHPVVTSQVYRCETSSLNHESIRAGYDESITALGAVADCVTLGGDALECQTNLRCGYASNINVTRSFYDWALASDGRYHCFDYTQDNLGVHAELIVPARHCRPRLTR